MGQPDFWTARTVFLVSRAPFLSSETSFTKKNGRRCFFFTRHPRWMKADAEELGNKVASRYAMIRLADGQGAVQLPSCIIARHGNRVKKYISPCPVPRNITLLAKWDNATVCDKLGATHARAPGDGRKSDEYSCRQLRGERSWYDGTARSASNVDQPAPYVRASFPTSMMATVHRDSFVDM